MIIGKKYLIMTLALIMFIWRLTIYPKLKDKKISNIELLDAVVHLGIFLGVFYIMDYSLPVKKPLNYFKTPAEF